jgi:TPR repeat protein
MLNRKLYPLRPTIKVFAFFCVLSLSTFSLADDELNSKATDLEPYATDAEAGIADAQYQLGHAYHVGEGAVQNYETAFYWYTKAAEQGNSEAQNNLGILYQNGLGVSRDYEQAFDWYTKAAEQGNSWAPSNLGDLYKNGQGVSQDYEKAFDWYTKAAEQGNSWAQNSLGVLYEKGQGVSQDYEKAFDWYTKAAEQGYSWAQNNLGTLYENGLGVSQDYEKAFDWYTKAAEQGNSWAQSNLGALYQLGEGVSQDYETAFYWYTKAAEQGYSVAKNNLGILYQYGLGVSQDYEKAFDWYTKAAEQGDSWAQSNLGALYQLGEGVSQDYETAFYWYTKAAEQGNLRAETSTGLAYYWGNGVTVDRPTGIEWLLKAAERGDSTSQSTLGFAYYWGQGVKKDYVSAVKWDSKAAMNGDSLSQLRLGHAYSDGLGVVQNDETGLEWYIKAAEQGNADAQYNVGVIYSSEQGVFKDYEKAFEWYSKAAEQGHVNAQNNLGLLYDWGEGVEQNPQKALELFTKAALNGDSNAQFNLGLAYSYGERKNIPSSLAYMKRAYDDGLLSAGFRVALQYLDKESGFYYPEAAFNILQATIHKGDSSASYFSNSLALLAHMYATGLYVPKDISKALDLLGKLVPGDIDSLVFELILPTLNITLTPKLSQKYVPYLRSALDESCISEFEKLDHQSFIANPIWELLRSITFMDGNLAGDCFDLYVKDQVVSGNYFIVAERYKVGVPGLIKVDKEKAFKYMLMAAESNSSADNAIAMDWVALFYSTGYGTVKNPAEALFWYQKAADLGFDFALNNLGWAYEIGELGLEIDIKKAFDYYNRAYLKGVDCNLCMTNLGRMYESGKAVNQDLSMAKILYTRAFNLGDLEAGNLLASLELEGLAGPKNEVSAIATLERVVSGNPTYKLSVGDASHDDEVNKARAKLEALGLINKPKSVLDLGDYFALVIGNSKYDNLVDLATAENDATEVAHVLANEYGFSVTLLLDANRQEMIKALNRYQRELKKSDNFLLYYAGHGRLDKTKEGYWQPVDADEIDNAQWIPNTRISRTLKMFNANNILIIADSCYAGSQLRGLEILPETVEDTRSSKNDGNTLIQRLNRSKSRVAMTSGGMEPVADRHGFSKNSIFAESFIQTLKLNSQTILAEDVFKKVRQRVVPITADHGYVQTPEYGQLHTSGHEGGDFIFRRVSL